MNIGLAATASEAATPEHPRACVAVDPALPIAPDIAVGKGMGTLDTTEWLRDDFGYVLRGVHWLVRQRTQYQFMEVGEHPHFGRILRLDGALQCSTLDEACYHERLVHTAMLAARQRRRVLIVGGGDGGSAEEVLKWADVQLVHQVEIDGDVLQAARVHLQAIHRGVLNGRDDRLEVHVGDGAAWFADCGESYDVILLDLTDDGGPSSELWQARFFASCAERLAVGGALALHVASPFSQLSTCSRTLAALRAHFCDVQPFSVSVPMSGGPWLMACCLGQGAGKGSVLDRLADTGVAGLLRSLQGPALEQFDAAIATAQCAMPPAWRRALG